MFSYIHLNQNLSCLAERRYQGTMFTLWLNGPGFRLCLVPAIVTPQSGTTYSHALPMGYARNWIADWERLIDGKRNVYTVLTPLPTRQNAMPMVHMRSVRHGMVGSSDVMSTPAAERTSLASDGGRASALLACRQTQS